MYTRILSAVAALTMGVVQPAVAQQAEASTY